MPIKRRKDKTNLLATFRVDCGKRHYFSGYYWEDLESMHKNTRTNGDACACCLPAPGHLYFEGEETDGIQHPYPMLGEIHLVKGHSSVEVIVHELCHALIQRMRAGHPKPGDLTTWDDMEVEEDLCYWMGAAVAQVYEFINREG